MYKRKILIMGLLGAGKTTLAKIVATKLSAIHYNADELRGSLTKHLSFSLRDRIEQARQMGLLCNIATQGGRYAVADFICPTEETRAALSSDNAFVVWVDRIFALPTQYNFRVLAKKGAEYWAGLICKAVLPHSARQTMKNVPKTNDGLVLK